MLSSVQEYSNVRVAAEQAWANVVEENAQKVHRWCGLRSEVLIKSLFEVREQEVERAQCFD